MNQAYDEQQVLPSSSLNLPETLGQTSDRRISEPWIKERIHQGIDSAVDVLKRYVQKFTLVIICYIKILQLLLHRDKVRLTYDGSFGEEDVPLV